jgi:hypothetical protein
MRAITFSGLSTHATNAARFSVNRQFVSAGEPFPAAEIADLPSSFDPRVARIHVGWTFMSVVWLSIAAQVKIGFWRRCLPVDRCLVNVSDMNVQGT